MQIKCDCFAVIGRLNRCSVCKCVLHEKGCQEGPRVFIISRQGDNYCITCGLACPGDEVMA